MPGWQQFLDSNQNKGFDILGVAVDMSGAEVVKPYAEKVGFNVVVDPENKLASAYNFNIVPNGIFVDEDNIIRFIKEGFNVSNEEHTTAIQNLIDGKKEYVELAESKREITQPFKKQLANTKFKLAQEYLVNNKKQEALKELDEALVLDADNFVIRKQRWYLRYPGKFKPTIDFEWQKEQLAKEREMEQCGPDGCPIPGL